MKLKDKDGTLCFQNCIGNIVTFDHNQDKLKTKTLKIIIILLHLIKISCGKLQASGPTIMGANGFIINSFFTGTHEQF